MNNLVSIPAEPLSVALFLQSLKSAKLSHSSLQQAASAVKWMHDAEIEQDPTDSPLLAQFLQADRRRKEGVSHKEPATEKHLIAIADFYDANNSEKNFRTLVMSVLAFAGCLRVGDFREVQRKHVNIVNNVLNLEIPKSKTDQFREGARKCIPRGPDSRICPVTLILKWLKLHVSRSQESPLFPMLTCPSKPISISSYREGLASALKNSGLPTITPHSFRAGFATQAINNGGTMDAIKEFGLWESEASVQRYARRSDSTKARTGLLAWKKN